MKSWFYFTYPIPHPLTKVLMYSGVLRRFRVMFLDFQLLWEPKGCSSEWHHINSAFDLFYHPFLNFGISAVRSLINKEIGNQLVDYSRLREVTSIVSENNMQKKPKPKTFLGAIEKNKLHGWTSRAEAQHGVHEYALYITGRRKRGWVN